MTCFLNSTGMSLFSHVFTVNDVDKWFGQGIIFNINLCRIKDNFATGRGVERVSIKNLRIWFEFLVLNLGQVSVAKACRPTKQPMGFGNVVESPGALRWPWSPGTICRRFEELARSMPQKKVHVDPLSFKRNPNLAFRSLIFTHTESPVQQNFQ